MTTTWAGSYVNLTYDSGPGLYYELADPSLWNDPLYNAGGASTSAAPCGPCHGYADLTNGVGPNEPNDYFGGPWYLRAYKPHNYPVIFDIDNDGLTDNLDNCPGASNIAQSDQDNDYIGDICDTCPDDPINDADYDGICANLDPCPYDQYDDFDGDGICGDIDNCDITASPVQTDSDGDGFGDPCDNCIDIPNPDQANSDYDMLGDLCDPTCSAYIELSIDTFSSPSNYIRGEDVAMGPQGTIYVVAETDGDIAGQIGLNDFVLLKYDSGGNILWTRQFGTIENDWLGGGVHVDAAGNAYVAGSKRGSAAAQYNIIAFKFDSDGNPIWNFETSGFGMGIAADSSGNVFLTSQEHKYHMGVIKLDPNGNELWRAIQYEGSYVYAMGLDVDAAGNVYAVGDIKSGETTIDHNIIVAKYNADGTHQWTKQLGTPEGDYPKAIVVDDAGNSYVTGGTDGSFGSLKGDIGTEYFTFKLDTSGNLIWKRQFRSSLSAYAEDIALDSAGNVYVTGGAEFGVVQGVDLISYDSDGNQRFASRFEGPYKIWSHGVAPDSSGNAYITGGIQSVSSGPYDLFLMKAGGQCQ
jgi:hypothetical protein